MRASRPYPINMLFDNVTTTTSSVLLLQLQQRAIMLLKLNRTVNSLLPKSLRPWCRVANIRQEEVLVLETANASWQMRLRYEQAQLLSALRIQILPLLSTIDIRINPVLERTVNFQIKNNSSCLLSNRQHKQKRRLSMKSAASIRHVAACSTGKLKKTLESLAKVAGKNTKSN